MTGRENRCGFVLYPAHTATHRLGSAAITPPTIFGNCGGHSSPTSSTPNYLSHGAHILGGQHALSIRLAWESAYQHHNVTQLCRSVICHGSSAKSIIQGTTVENLDGVLVPCDPPPFDPVEDVDLLHHWRARFAFHEDTSRMYQVAMTNHQYRSTQRRLTTQCIDLATPRSTRNMIQSQVPQLTAQWVIVR
jgi:hypothetical protein